MLFSKDLKPLLAIVENLSITSRAIVVSVAHGMLQNVTTKGNKTRACFLETNNDHVQTVARARRAFVLLVVPLVSARIEGTENKTPSRRRKRGFLFLYRSQNARECRKNARQACS